MRTILAKRFIAAAAPALLVLLCLMPLGSVGAQPFTLKSTQIGGAPPSSGGGFTVVGETGKSDSGESSGGGFTAKGGVSGLMAVLQTPGAPVLTLTRAGGGAVISWPADATGYALEVSTSLSAFGAWQVVGQTPVESNGMKSVTIAFQPGARFYRLRRSTEQ